MTLQKLIFDTFIKTTHINTICQRRHVERIVYTKILAYLPLPSYISADMNIYSITMPFDLSYENLICVIDLKL